MSRLEISTPDKAQLVVEGLYKDLERRIESSPPGLCPVDISRAFLELCHAQTCGKCVPCRIGLGQLKNLITDVLDGKATLKTLDLMEDLAMKPHIWYTKALSATGKTTKNISVRDAVPARSTNQYLVFLSVRQRLISLDTSHL